MIHKVDKINGDRNPLSSCCTRPLLANMKATQYQDSKQFRINFIYCSKCKKNFDDLLQSDQIETSKRKSNIASVSEALFSKSITISFTFLVCWFDIWVGAYYDREKKVWYIFPVPFLGFKLKITR